MAVHLRLAVFRQQVAADAGKMEAAAAALLLGRAALRLGSGLAMYRPLPLRKALTVVM
jgi:hypothetical protein